MIPVLALMLAAVIITASSLYLAAAADDLEYFRISSEGDASFADGYSVRLTTETGDYLFSEICVETGSDVGTSVEKTQYIPYAWNNSYYYTEDEDYFFFGISFVTEGSVYAETGIDLDDLDLNGLTVLPLKDAAEKTAAGQTLTEIIYLADYCEYFPIYAYAEIYDSASDDYISFDEDELSGLFSEFFLAKVPDDFEMEVTITKDDDGNIIEVSLYVPEDDTDAQSNLAYGPYEIYAYTEDSCFFTFAAYSDETYGLSGSAGFGIYSFDYAVKDGEEYAEVSDLSLIYEIDPEEADILGLAVDEDGRLYIEAIEDGSITVTILEANTYEVVQKLTLTEAASLEEELDYYGQAEYKDGFVLLQTASGLAAVYFDEDENEYTSDLFPMDEEDYEYIFESYNYISYVLEDEKLAIAAANGDDDTFRVIVCTGEGIAYIGEYSSGLDGLAADEEYETVIISLELSSY